MKIAVLALQGAFREHRQMLGKLGVESMEIRSKKDAEENYDGLIIPGGESTVIIKLLKELSILDVIKEKINCGLPVFGTCAGLIVLAKDVDNDQRRGLEAMDVSVVRNAYGRQLGSFYTQDLFDGKLIPMTFIRAPYISKANGDVKVLSVVDDKIVSARQNNLLVTAFHPELNEDLTVHKYFIEMVKNSLYDSNR